MRDDARTLGKADDRRRATIASAIPVFAAGGYLGTPVAKVAERAGISPAYVFKLFPSKEALFVAALDACFARIEDSLAGGAARAASADPAALLDAMGAAYADLIADRDLIMLQVHAQAATDVPEIRLALVRGLERITRFVKRRTGADDDAVQLFVARGQLCHLITTAELTAAAGDWADILTHGFRHPTLNSGPDHG